MKIDSIKPIWESLYIKKSRYGTVPVLQTPTIEEFKIERLPGLPKLKTKRKPIKCSVEVLEE